MVKLKTSKIVKKICDTCHGNGYVRVATGDTAIDFRDNSQVHQCWDCDSEGEYYVTTNNNLIGNPDYDDDNDLLEWLREIPVRRV